MKTMRLLVLICGLFFSPNLFAQYTLRYFTNEGVGVIGYTGTPVNVTIPNFVTYIGDAAFWGCSSLTSVTISDSVISIGGSPFWICTNLTNIMVSSNNLAFNSINGVLFNKGDTILIAFPAGVGGSYTIPNSVTNIGNNQYEAFATCIGLTNVIVPNSVTYIGEPAFTGCTGLTQITIPKSVTSIGDGAFGSCTNLTSVYFEGNAPSADSSVFAGPGEVGHDPATAYYLFGTTGWDVFSADTGIPAVLWNPTIQTTGNFGFKNNQFSFTVTGTTNIPIQIAATANLGLGTWTPVVTCTLTNGLIRFSDLGSSNYPRRFYTVQFP